MIGSSKIGLRPIRGGGGGAAPNPDFISTWDTTQAGSASDTVTLPLLSGGTYSGTIDWGDGNSDTLSYANRTHVYGSSGTYIITLSGTIEGWTFNNGGDRRKITDVSNWGNFTLDSSSTRAFFNCSNLAVAATDSPSITSSASSISRIFASCSNITALNLSGMDTSNITTANQVFESSNNISSANISAWDVSSITDISGMFNNCDALTDNLSSWNLANNETLSNTFNGCDGSFMSTIASWDTSNVTTFSGTFRSSSVNTNISAWDVSSVTTFNRCFMQASSFNQPIGVWNVGSCLDFTRMFYAANSFDQDISSWQVTQATNLTFFMTGATLSTANYDALLIAWDAQGAMSYSGTVDFGGSQYTSGGAAEAARTSLITKWGGITDGGAA